MVAPVFVIGTTPMEQEDSCILTNSQASEIVQRIQKFHVYQLGSVEFLKQHQDIQKLNLQAHKNVAFDEEEWVSELINTFDKWDVIIYNLLVCYQYRQKYDLHLLKHYQFDEVQQTQASILLYSIYFHEAVLLDLISARIVDQLPQTNYLPELLDYLSHLFDRALVDELKYQKNDLEFKSIITAFTILRGISCQKAELQTEFKLRSHRFHSKVAQILVQQDKIYYRTKKDLCEIYEDGEWHEMQKSMMPFKISKTQGQLLIALLGLSTLNDNYTNQEIDAFSLLKATINDSQVDQIPQLKELRAFYERLCLQQQQSDLGNYQQKVAEQFNAFDRPKVAVVDVISSLYGQQEQLVKRFIQQKVGPIESDNKITQKQTTDGVVELTSNKTVIDEETDLKIICDEIFKHICQFNTQTQTIEAQFDKVFPNCVCGQVAKFRCARCKQVWYCGKECQVKDWSSHKKTCKAGQTKDPSKNVSDKEIKELLKKIEKQGDVKYD